jgi:hypothetical protein
MGIPLEAAVAAWSALLFFSSAPWSRRREMMAGVPLAAAESKGDDSPSAFRVGSAPLEENPSD